MFVAELERERKLQGISQSQLASRIGLSERAYRGYINGEREIHPYTQSLIAKLLKSPKLATEVLSQFEDNPFAPAVLEVDDHPAQELCAALNELREALDAICQVNPCKPDKSKIEHAIDQMMDLVHLIPLVAGSWSRAYGVDLWILKRKNLAKLQARGYLRKERDAA